MVTSSMVTFPDSPAAHSFPAPHGALAPRGAPALATIAGLLLACGLAGCGGMSDPTGLLGGRSAATPPPSSAPSASPI